MPDFYKNSFKSLRKTWMKKVAKARCAKIIARKRRGGGGWFNPAVLGLKRQGDRRNVSTAEIAYLTSFDIWDTYMTFDPRISMEANLAHFYQPSLITKQAYGWNVINP